LCQNKHEMHKSGWNGSCPLHPSMEFKGIDHARVVLIHENICGPAWMVQIQRLAAWFPDSRKRGYQHCSQCCMESWTTWIEELIELSNPSKVGEPNTKQ
jgi:hypothetical protein